MSLKPSIKPATRSATAASPYPVRLSVRKLSSCPKIPITLDTAGATEEIAPDIPLNTPLITVAIPLKILNTLLNAPSTLETTRNAPPNSITFAKN